MFHQLTYLEDGDEVVVGSAATGSYAVLPPEGAALLRRLTEGIATDAAARWFHGQYGEDVDVDDFVESLRDLGFVRDGELSLDPPPIRFRRLGTALFSAPAWVLYAVLVTAAVVLAVHDPGLRPRPQNVFFSHWLVLVEASTFVAQIPLVMLHESFHVLAGRRLGLPSRVRLSNRWYFLVLETDMDALVTVPRRQRYLPMLAGLLLDALVVSAATLIAGGLRGPADGLPGATVAAAFALALAYTTLPRMIWQCSLSLRTDLYHLLSTVLGCQNLHEAAQVRIRNLFRRLPGRTAKPLPEDGFSSRDRRAARWYAPVLMIISPVSLLITVFVTGPVLWRFFHTAIERAQHGGGTQQWDSVAFLVFTVMPMALAGLLSLRRRISLRNGASHA
jgi:hypothetical protein